MRNVLVTGGAGFIGSNFIRHLQVAEPEVRIVNLDALTYAGTLENLQGLPDSTRHEFVHGSICDDGLVRQIFKRHDVDTVFHFAAESHVDRSIAGPATFVETNINGTFVLLEAARNAWPNTPEQQGRRFHHVSTDEVYGDLGPTDPAFHEHTAYSPSSPYSASKAAADHLVRAYARTYGLPATLTNCSNNYGPYQFPEKLIPMVIFNALRGKPIPIYGDGLQIRDWPFVDDHCEAVYVVAKRGRNGATYNVGGDNQPTNLDLVQTICKLLDRKYPQSAHRPHFNLMSFVKDRPGHDRRYAMNIGRISSELGWRPKHTLASGLEKTIDWYLANEAWLNAVSASSGGAREGELA